MYVASNKAKVIRDRKDSVKRQQYTCDRQLAIDIVISNKNEALLTSKLYVDKKSIPQLKAKSPSYRTLNMRKICSQACKNEIIWFWVN